MPYESPHVYIISIYRGINNLTLITRDNIRKIESLGIKGPLCALQINHYLDSSLHKQSAKRVNG